MYEYQCGEFVRETGVIFNPGLSADRPSNNWAQLFKEFQIVQDYG